MRVQISGKKLKILDEVLSKMERTLLERHAQTPAVAVRKEFASQVRIQKAFDIDMWTRTRIRMLMSHAYRNMNITQEQALACTNTST